MQFTPEREETCPPLDEVLLALFYLRSTIPSNHSRRNHQLRPQKKKKRGRNCRGILIHAEIKNKIQVKKLYNLSDMDDDNKK